MTWQIPTWYGTILLSLAAYRVWRVLAEDTILDRPRARAAPAESKPRPRNAPRKKPADTAATAAQDTPTARAEAPATKAGALPMPMALLRRAIEDASDEQGWAHLGAVGSYLTKIRPDFDPRLYGQRKLSDLFRRDTRHFAIEERPGPGGSKTIYVRALD